MKEKKNEWRKVEASACSPPEPMSSSTQHIVAASESFRNSGSIQCVLQGL